MFLSTNSFLSEVMAGRDLLLHEGKEKEKGREGGEGRTSERERNNYIIFIKR